MDVDQSARIPSVTFASMEAINDSAPDGTVVYNTESHGLMIMSGGRWVEVSAHSKHDNFIVLDSLSALTEQMEKAKTVKRIIWENNLEEEPYAKTIEEAIQLGTGLEEALEGAYDFFWENNIERSYVLETQDAP